MGGHGSKLRRESTATVRGVTPAKDGAHPLPVTSTPPQPVTLPHGARRGNHLTGATTIGAATKGA